MNFSLTILVAIGVAALLYIQVDLGMSVDDMSLAIYGFFERNNFWSTAAIGVAFVFTVLYISRIGRR